MSRFDNNCLWITGHVHDGVVPAVLVGVFGDEGEAAYLGVADPVQGGLSHDAAEFDLVQKFHCKQVYGVVLGPSTRARFRLTAGTKVGGQPSESRGKWPSERIFL